MVDPRTNGQQRQSSRGARGARRLWGSGAAEEPEEPWRAGDRERQGRGLGASRASKSYFAASSLTTRAVFRVIVFAINFFVEMFTRWGVSSNASPVGSLKLATAPGPSTVELLGVSHLTREVIGGH